jgi:Rieske Fe-S protein
VSTSRRGFLKGLVGAGAGAAAVGVPGCAPDSDPAPVLDAEVDAEGKVNLRVPRYPDLSRDGGAVTLRISGQVPLLVVHPSGNTFEVLDATCTHVGCPLGFDGAEVVCPCHGSRFDTQGQVLRRPATVALRHYESSYNSATETLTIDLEAGDVGFPAVVDGKLVLTFEQFPALRSPGGVVSGTPKGYGKLLFVFALEDGSYQGVDSICTHQQCTVGFNTGQGRLLCPCHGSAFDKRGQVLNPPATKKLKTFPAAADATGVTVQIA